MFTEEERKAAMQKRQQKIAEYKKLDMRQEYSDEPMWRELVSGFGVRLPSYYYPPEKKIVRRFLRKAGYTQSEFESLTGGSLDELINFNVKWPAWAICGVCLELLKEAEA